jgi:hypothetical protein
LIIRNSGGHPSITNISGLNFLKYNREMLNISYGTEKYVDVLKKIARDFVNNLKEKIDISNSGKSVSYDTGDVELLGQDTNENYNYHILSKETGSPIQVSREDFLKAGSSKGMRPEKLMIDHQNKKVIAKFENFKKFNR